MDITTLGAAMAMAKKVMPQVTAADAGKLATVDSNGKWAAADLEVGQGEVAVDSTLLVSGAAADAKVAGDKVNELKSAIGDTNDSVDAVYTGILTYTKEQAIRNSTLLSTGYLYATTGITEGESTLNDVTKSQSPGAKAYKINLKNIKKLTYPLFKTSAYYGSLIFDENDVVLWEYAERSLDTGSTKTIDVPSGASYMLLSISAALDASAWGLTFYKASLNNVDETTEETKLRVDLLYGKTYTKNETLGAFETISRSLLYLLTGITPGVSKLSNIVAGPAPGAYALKIDLTNIKTITYPVFKSSSNYGSFIFDNENTVLWMYTETTENTGTLKTIDVPENASYMLLSISSSLSAINWSIILYAIKQGTNDGEISDVTPFKNVNRNMCLAGIKTDILTSKIPFHRGYLFHTLLNGDYSLWYGEKFDNIQKLGDVSYDPKLMRFAISPKDGRIIACQRDTRNGIWVWDGETETHLNGFTTNPMAWLYNSGVDFINDSSNVEHCVFAEYSGNPSSGMTFNVWRGTYPYTSASDWEIVMTQSFPDIMHFHQVRRDPWSNVLYLTCGDNDGQNKWWYSIDYGATWTLLVSDSVAGWGNQVLRTINFIFTADYVYWAIDHGENTHALYKIKRNNQSNIIDLSTKAKVADLDGLKATNSLCYVETPNGLFMYDRIDTAPSSEYGKPITMKFWSFDTEELVDIVTIGIVSETWGGSRGKCYINYTNSKQPMPAMGFSVDTPCIFDLVCDNPANIGTIAYDIGSKTIHTIDY